MRKREEIQAVLHEEVDMKADVQLPMTKQQAKTLWWLLEGEIGRHGITDRQRRTFRQIKQRLERSEICQKTRKATDSMLSPPAKPEANSCRTSTDSLSGDRMGKDC